jgi:hypothetical protein
MMTRDGPDPSLIGIERRKGLEACRRATPNSASSSRSKKSTHLDTLAERSLRDLFSPPLAHISGSACASSRLAATPLGPASVAASLVSAVRRDEEGDDDDGFDALPLLLPLPSARRGTDFAVTAAPPLPPRLLLPPPPPLLDQAASLVPANTPRLTSTRPQRTRRAMALALVRRGAVFESGLKAIENKIENEAIRKLSHFFF